jgi:hypothetical protein
VSGPSSLGVEYSPQNPEFGPGPAHVRLWWLKWHCNREICEYFRFPLLVSFHHCSILVFVCVLLLPEEPTGETCDPSKNSALSETGEHWIGKYCHCCCLQKVWGSPEWLVLFLECCILISEWKKSKWNVIPITFLAEPGSVLALSDWVSAPLWAFCV